MCVSLDGNCSSAMSASEKERIFQTELIKSGVPRLHAERAAKILASNEYHNKLSEEDRQLVDASCQRWFKYRQLINQISQILDGKATVD
jgi:uncharacterized protein with von Willebrand factor type A (vWA) domain